MIKTYYHVLDRVYNRRYFKLFYRIVKCLLNITIPIFTLVTTTKKLDPNSEYLVSFTSFPRRIKKAYLVAECLLRQDVMPCGIHLYLSREQFPNDNLLPWRLRRLRSKGLLSIIFVEGDIRSHKKYYYAFRDHKDKNIVVVDDDMFYPEDLLYGLSQAHQIDKKAICCNRAYQIKTENGKILPYKRWQKDVSLYDIQIRNLLPIGCGGVLYPKGTFDGSDLLNIRKALYLCPTADDIWLRIQTMRSGVLVIRSSHYKHPIFCDVIVHNNTTLNDNNVGNCQNDVQLENMIAEYPECLDLLK